MFFDKTSSLRESFASLTLMLNLSQLGCKAEMITSQPDCLHEMAMFMMSFSILSDSSSDLKSYVPMFKMTLSGFSSVEGLTKVDICFVVAPENDLTDTLPGLMILTNGSH